MTTIVTEKEVASEFHVGQLVSVNGRSLGEVMEVLEGGLYRVWEETDYDHSDCITIPGSKLEAVPA